MVRIQWLFVLAALTLAAPSTVSAAPALSGGSPLAPAMPGAAHLHKADIFRDCLNVEGRWRCRTCTFVRRCGRTGCSWEEQCRWGPPVSPIPE